MAAQMTGGCYQITGSINVYASRSTDGSRLYVSTTLSGRYNMTAVSPCRLPEAGFHYPMTEALLTSSSGMQAGGWKRDPNTCISCYLTSIDRADLPLLQGESYDFTWQGSAYCSSSGLLATMFGRISLSPAFTTGDLSAVTYGASGPLGVYYPACLPGQTPVCGANPQHSFAIQFGQGETPWEFASNSFLAVRYNGIVQECIAWPVATPEEGPGPCW
jgi:hypothetical protein